MNDMNDWIRIEDGTPEDGEHILMYDKWIYMGMYKNGGWIDNEIDQTMGSNYEWPNTTHWMPLPKAPTT